MTFFIPVERVKEFSDLVMGALNTFDLPPTPENYELWFVYYSGAEPEVKHAIDNVLDQQAIDNETCMEIHKKFLCTGTNSKLVEGVGNQVQKTIKDVSEAMDMANGWMDGYEVNLQETQEKLSLDKNNEENRKLLENIIGETRSMLQKNAGMKELLRRSTIVISEMHRDLELARKEAVTDGLTGLANRKHFDLEIKHLTDAVLEEENTTLSLLMLDIDHFKTFNDKFGHQVGDQVLKLLAKTLNDGVKGRDLACRYGGEEFSILLPDTNLDQSVHVAESIRKAISQKDIVNRSTGKHIAKVTISVGVSEYNTGEKIDHFIERADKALYKAKERGRNQVISLSYTSDMASRP